MIEGIVTVLAVYLIGSRWNGYAVGLFAAAATVATPLLPSLFGHVMEDGLLTMSLALAFVCFQSAIRTGRLGPLLFCAFWIAVGFQAKMMQAWLIVPGFAIAYLLVAPHGVYRRIGRSLLAGAVLIVLSLSWMTAIQLVPAASRPYIDGSTNNNIYSMVFGYNGLNRLVPNLIPGAVSDRTPILKRPETRATVEPASLRSPVHATAVPLYAAVTPALPATANSVPTPVRYRHDKLLLPFYTTQVGWLYPAAILGLIMTLTPLFRRFRFQKSRPAARATPPDTSAATAIAMGTWTTLGVVLLSIAKLPHAAYVAAISVQLAVLASIGLVGAIRLFSDNRGSAKAVLPALVAVQVVWAIAILRTSQLGLTFLVVGIVVVTVIAVGAILVAVMRDGQRTPLRVAVAAAMVAVLLAPATWTASVLDRRDEGSAGEAYAGPEPAEQPSRATPAQVDALEAHPARWTTFRLHPPFQIPANPRLPLFRRDLLRYVLAHQTGPSRWVMATDQWASAAPYIIDAGANVLPMGGFSGRINTPTFRQFRAEATSGELRFVLLTMPLPASFVETRNLDEIRAWVTTHCVLVPANEYEGKDVAPQQQSLYSCSAKSAHV